MPIQESLGLREEFNVTRSASMEAKQSLGPINVYMETRWKNAGFPGERGFLIRRMKRGTLRNNSLVAELLTIAPEQLSRVYTRRNRRGDQLRVRENSDGIRNKIM